MKPVDPSKLCILITVYHPYRWVAPYTWRLIEEFWPNHPPVFFCGLTSEEAGDLPHIPCHMPLPRVWADFALEAVKELAARGFDLTYFMLEDHPPLAACHEKHLNETLPGLMNTLPASYIGLMGWDNRRYSTRGGPVGDPHRFMHLVNPLAPRFHLHPALFRVSTLVACLDALSKSPKPNPWGFEKLCDKTDAPLPEEDKLACYQICGEELALHPPDALGKAVSGLERGVYHKLMNLYPAMNRLGVGMKFWDTLGFDNFFHNGPFPMFYSGVMSRARVNPYFLPYVEQQKNPIFDELVQAARREGKA